MKKSAAVAFLCIIVGAQALSSEQKDLLKQYAKKCLLDTGVDRALVDEERRGKFNSDLKLTQYIFCVLRAGEILNENGDPRPEKIKEKLRDDYTPAQIDDFLTKCTPKSTDLIEKIGEFWKCYRANAPKPIDLS